VSHSHHSHEGGGHHHHAPKDFGRAFLIGIVLNTVFVVAEAGLGIWSGSLSLVADAGHNLSDVLGLALAWAAAALVKRPPSDRRTYGWKRSSILAALANAIFLLISIGIIAWEAVKRLEHPHPLQPGVMMIVGAIGILVNGGTALLFMSGSKDDLNIRGAFLHMIADAAITLGVVVTGLTIALTGFDWLDSAVSLVIAAVVVWGTWGLLKDSFNLSLDAVPAAIDTEKVRDYLAGLDRVRDVHDLHIWALSTTEVALTAHLVVEGEEREDALVHQVQEELHEKFEIHHATLQIETPGHERGHADVDCET